MVDLTHLNTLQVPIFANELIELTTIEDLKKINPNELYMFLGSGANVLFTKNFPGTIYKNNLTGINQHDTLVNVSSGHLWHDFSTWAVENELSGNENMALIPGTVGAAVVGNIAAYGQNQEDIFVSCQALEVSTGKFHTFQKPELNFAYRDSIFRHEFANKYFIVSVTYQLSKTPQFSLAYDAKRHQNILSKINEIKFAQADQENRAQQSRFGTAEVGSSSTDFSSTEQITSHDVYNAVIALRTEKLPDWKTLPNAGSFFKNPTVSQADFQKLKLLVPDLQSYPVEKLIQTNSDALEDFVKVPAGRLLDELGWRGKRIGNIGTHASQALCVINYGATGEEIYAFTEGMRADIKKNYAIDLEYEVQII